MAFSLSKDARALLEARTHPWSAPPMGLRFVVAAVVALLRRAARGEIPRAVADEALLHAMVSVDDARADRVHLRAQVGSRVVGFRDVVAALASWPRQHVGGAIRDITTTADGHFDVDAKEAFARVVSTYTIQYSNFMPYAPAVRRNFFNDTAAAQQGFLRDFLALFDADTDVTHLPGAPAAAGWLRERRVYLAQHTLVLRDDLDRAANVDVDVDVDAIERELREAQADFADIVTRVNRGSLAEFRAATRDGDDDRRWSHIHDDDLATELSWLAKQARASLTATPREHAGPLVELLTALHVPPQRQALQALTAACGSLAAEALPDRPAQPSVEAALPQLHAARDRLARAAQTAWQLAC